MIFLQELMDEEKFLFVSIPLGVIEGGQSVVAPDLVVKDQTECILPVCIHD